MMHNFNYNYPQQMYYNPNNQGFGADQVQYQQGLDFLQQQQQLQQQKQFVQGQGVPSLQGNAHLQYQNSQMELMRPYCNTFQNPPYQQLNQFWEQSQQPQSQPQQAPQQQLQQQQVQQHQQALSYPQKSKVIISPVIEPQVSTNNNNLGFNLNLNSVPSLQQQQQQHQPFYGNPMFQQNYPHPYWNQQPVPLMHSVGIEPCYQQKLEGMMGENFSPYPNLNAQPQYLPRMPHLAQDPNLHFHSSYPTHFPYQNPLLKKEDEVKNKIIEDSTEKKNTQQSTEDTIKKPTNYSKKPYKDTKNIPKNYTKAILRYLKQHQESLLRFLGNFELVKKFIQRIENKKDKIISIREFKSLFEHVSQDPLETRLFCKVFRVMAFKFIRQEILPYLLQNKKIKDIESMFKYRRIIQHGLSIPEQFVCWKFINPEKLKKRK